MTKRLLIVHHTPSPHTHEMFEAVVSGATDPEIEGGLRCATTGPNGLADRRAGSRGYLLGSPANLGYMSGALKQ